MSLKTRGILVVVIGSILGFSLSLGGASLSGRSQASTKELSWEQARLFAEVMERVKRDYVDPIDDAQLLESAVRGMVADLDRHSEYLDADEFQDVRISTSGSYSGVGLEVSTENGAIVVIAPIDGTPAQRAGIESGDEIVEIDGVSVANNGLDKTIDKMRGRPGTPIALTVQRENYDERLTFYLTRQKIQVASVRYEILQPSFGYLRLSQFNETTTEEASSAIDAMMEEVQASTGNMLTGLILDLRNNPGGLLDSAVAISDLFLDSGIIVTAEGRTPESRFMREAQDGDILDGATIVVLVNGGSASASEIVAGALQDHHRATIVGTTTFGKGLVQTVMPLSKGRAVKLTTSRYFTPSGDSIHEVGVSPDIVVEGTRQFPNQNLQTGVDRETDVQLMEALQRLKHQRVMHSRAPD
ncbi:MAG: peptidase S41 [Gammaproteobacteria bacterium]|nr:MAG: peptidase S41 [Gammaproteobacteria bacterium]RLA33911.1 MAG: peptidase S41 [Gammaproteobacteria bacterium]